MFEKFLDQMDTQLTLMLTLESLVPYATQLIYANITRDWSKTSLQLTWENVFIMYFSLRVFMFRSFRILAFVEKSNNYSKEKKPIHPENHTASIIHQH
jgi:hypothetical protein